MKENERLLPVSEISHFAGESQSARKSKLITLGSKKDKQLITLVVALKYYFCLRLAPVTTRYDAIVCSKE